jgi:hypothetical protein
VSDTAATSARAGRIDRYGARRPSATLASGRRRLLAQALPLLVAGVLASGLVFNGFNSAAGQAIGAILSCLMLAAVILDRAPDVRLWRAMLPVLVPALTGIAWLALGAAGLHPWPTTQAVPLAPDLAGPELVGAAGALAALVAGGLLGADRRLVFRILVLVIALACCSFVAGLVIREAGGAGALGYWTAERRGRFAGTIGNVNTLAAVAGGVLLLSLALGAQSVLAAGGAWKGVARTPAWLGFALAAALASGTMVLTAARFPLVMLVSVLLLGAGWVAIRSRRVPRGLPAFAAVALLLLALIGWANSDLLTERLGSTGSDGLVRLQMWSHYWQLAWESPLYGYGAGSFPALNEARLDSPALARSLWIVNSPHNILLQLMLAGGLPYLLLIVAAAGMLAWPVARLMVSPAARAEDAGLCGWVILVLGCAMVDLALDVPGMVTLTLFLAGLLWGRALRGGGGAAKADRVGSGRRGSTFPSGADAGAAA